MTARRILALVAALAVTVAACDGRGSTANTFSRASASADGMAEYVQYTRGGRIKLNQVNGMAFGRLWRQETRDKRELQRGVDAYKWAIRTCQAVIDGQTPEAMVRAIHDDVGVDQRGRPARFSKQGARVIVTAALRALCPDHRPAPGTAGLTGSWLTDTQP
jgi:hypothetical protein